MRLSEARRLAQVDDLARHGYQYTFSAATPGRETGLTIPALAALSSSGAVPTRGGWADKAKLVLELLGVLGASGLICLLVNVLESRRSVEAALGDANQRLARETEARKQALSEHQAARNESAAAQAEVNRLQSALQSNNEQEVRLGISLRAAEAAAQATQAELDQARMARQQAEQTIASLQSRLRSRARAEEKAPAAPPPPQPEPPPSPEVPAQVDEAPPVSEPSPELSPASVTELQATPEPSTPAEVNAAAPSLSAPAAEAVPIVATSPEPEPIAAPIPAEEPPAATVLPPDPPAEPKPKRAPRRKKVLRNPQIELFASPPLEEPIPATPPPDASPDKPAVEAVSLPLVELLPPLAASEPAEPEAVAVEAPEQALAEATPKEMKPARALPTRPPLDLAQLRKAVNLILPLFTGRDPGARDCLKDNRTTFRSAFAPEAYVEFEGSVKSGDFDAALEHLRKAAKKHGIPA